MTRVKIATREECELRDRATYAAWGERLSLEQLLERERRLRAHAWSVSAMKTWLLVGDGGKVLSSCETFAMTAERDGARFPAHGIASVFTEESLRGRGYATTLLQGVLAELERESTNTAFLLYSEVGPAMYERLGFHLLESFEWMTGRVTDFSTLVKNTTVSATPLSLPEIRALTQTSVRAPARSPAGQARILSSFRLSFDQLDWHWERGRIYAAYLARPRPEFQGLRGPMGGYSFWAANYKGSVLHALVFAPANEEDALAMLTRADQERQRLGLGQTCFWETPLALPGTLAGALAGLGWHRQKREDALAMIRPTQLIAEIPRALWV